MLKRHLLARDERGIYRLSNGLKTRENELCQFAATWGWMAGLKHLDTFAWLLVMPSMRSAISSSVDRLQHPLGKLSQTSEAHMQIIRWILRRKEMALPGTLRCLELARDHNRDDVVLQILLSLRTKARWLPDPREEVFWHEPFSSPINTTFAWGAHHRHIKVVAVCLQLGSPCVYLSPLAALYGSTRVLKYVLRCIARKVDPDSFAAVKRSLILSIKDNILVLDRVMSKRKRKKILKMLGEQ